MSTFELHTSIFVTTTPARSPEKSAELSASPRPISLISIIYPISSLYFFRLESRPTSCQPQQCSMSSRLGSTVKFAFIVFIYTLFRALFITFQNSRLSGQIPIFVYYFCYYFCLVLMTRVSSRPTGRPTQRGRCYEKRGAHGVCTSAYSNLYLILSYHITWPHHLTSFYIHTRS